MKAVIETSAPMTSAPMQSGGAVVNPVTGAEYVPVRDLGAPELELYTHLNESQLRHYNEPEPEGVFIAESPTSVSRALDAGYYLLSMLVEDRYLGAWELEKENSPEVGADLVGKAMGEAQTLIARVAQEGKRTGRAIPVYHGPISVLSRLTGYHLTRGILAAFRRKRPQTVEEVCRNAHRIAVLENVENPTNVGAIFRCAAALGMDAVLLTPACADPLQRRAIRVSVGTVFQIPWTYIGEELTPAHRRALGLPVTGTAQGMADDPNIREEMPAPLWPDRGIRRLHAMGFQVTALALRNNTVDLTDPALRQADRLALILGNEGDGLPERTVELCDYTVRIPMSHGVDSLNVAAAAAVAFWELGRGRTENEPVPDPSGSGAAGPDALQGEEKP